MHAPPERTESPFPLNQPDSDLPYFPGCCPIQTGWYRLEGHQQEEEEERNGVPFFYGEAGKEILAVPVDADVQGVELV